MGKPTTTQPQTRTQQILYSLASHSLSALEALGENLIRHQEGYFDRGILHGNTWRFDREEARGVARRCKRGDKQKFYSMLAHLKKEGFIQNKKDTAGPLLWFITPSGRKKLDALKSSPTKRMRTIYPTTDGGALSIVAFDIPETRRRYREWISEVLGILNYQRIQKSVWAGTTKIPEDFIADAHRYKVFEYLDIFEVGKRGTLQKRM